MAFQRLWSTFHDSTLSNAPHNYLVVSVGAPGKVCRIHAKGAISWAAQTQVATSTLQTNIQHGFQQVPAGTAAANMEGGSFFYPQWLQAEGITPSPTSIFWAPSSATAAFEDRYAVDLYWGGQFRYLAGIDIYYSIGRFNVPAVGFGFYGAVEVFYDF